jgi:hypothetical protein
VIGRIVVFFVWAIACLVIFFLAMLMTQMGDCFDVQRCIVFKQRAAYVILIAVPAIWLAGSVFMVYRWNRD